MENEIKIFESEEFGSIRTLEESGKVFFCDKDAATALGYRDTVNAIKAHCKEDGVVIHHLIDSMGRKQAAKFISEGNLYRLISHSRLPSAEKFESWIFDEVLPTIRRTGGYVANEDIFIENYLPFLEEPYQGLFRLQMMAINQLNERIRHDQPLVEFANQVSNTENLIDMNAMAKLAIEESIPIGRNRLFRWLRENEILIGIRKTVYFKEFGDKRVMDKHTGAYTDSAALDDQANEILEFRIGSKPYGQVRWNGQILGIDGSRRAENLNNNYFENGRHTPMAVIIRGGTLTEESYKKLQEYMNDIKGEAGQHSFLLLEAENNENSTGMSDEKQPEIEIKDLAGILQHDELFQGYLENNRKRVQSAFRLPDLYTGYSTDFNRATAQMAMEVTEKQVFQPERQSLAWIINNKLLAEYCFENVEAYFKEPDITNPDDLYKILSVSSNAGGLTPNKAKEIAYNALGDVSDDYEGDWGNIPLAYQKIQPAVSGLEAQIAKARENHDDEIVSIMKSVRSLLLDMSKGG